MSKCLLCRFSRTAVDRLTIITSCSPHKLYQSFYFSADSMFVGVNRLFSCLITFSKVLSKMFYVLCNDRFTFKHDLSLIHALARYSTPALNWVKQITSRTPQWFKVHDHVTNMMFLFRSLPRLKILNVYIFSWFYVSYKRIEICFWKRPRAFEFNFWFPN